MHSGIYRKQKCVYLGKGTDGLTGRAGKGDSEKEDTGEIAEAEIECAHGQGTIVWRDAPVAHGERFWRKV